MAPLPAKSGLNSQCDNSYTGGQKADKMKHLKAEGKCSIVTTM